MAIRKRISDQSLKMNFNARIRPDIDHLSLTMLYQGGALLHLDMPRLRALQLRDRLNVLYPIGKD